MEDRRMSYPKIVPWLAGTHGIPIVRAERLWDRAVAYSKALVGITREGTPDWASVIAIFLEFARHEPHAHRVTAGSRASHHRACGETRPHTSREGGRAALLR
jgi:hypothetical protein